MFLKGAVDLAGAEKDMDAEFYFRVHRVYILTKGRIVLGKDLILQIDKEAIYISNYTRNWQRANQIITMRCPKKLSDIKYIGNVWRAMTRKMKKHRKKIYWHLKLVVSNTDCLEKFRFSINLGLASLQTIAMSQYTKTYKKFNFFLSVIRLMLWVAIVLFSCSKRMRYFSCVVTLLFSANQNTRLCLLIDFVWVVLCFNNDHSVHFSVSKFYYNLKI